MACLFPLVEAVTAIAWMRILMLAKTTRGVAIAVGGRRRFFAGFLSGTVFSFREIINGVVAGSAATVAEGTTLVFQDANGHPLARFIAGSAGTLSFTTNLTPTYGAPSTTITEKLILSDDVSADFASRTVPGTALGLGTATAVYAVSGLKRFGIRNIVYTSGSLGMQVPAPAIPYIGQLEADAEVTLSVLRGSAAVGIYLGGESNTLLFVATVGHGRETKTADFLLHKFVATYDDEEELAEVVLSALPTSGGFGAAYVPLSSIHQQLSAAFPLEGKVTGPIVGRGVSFQGLI